MRETTQLERRNGLAAQVRWGLAMFVFLLTFDGAIRKWLFPGAEQIIFVIKDVLLLGILIIVAARKALRATGLPQLVRVSLIMYATWIAIEVWNPELPNIWLGLWGLKAHLLYMGMIFLIPLAFRDVPSFLQSLEKTYAYVAIPVCALAFIQVAAGDDSALNQYVRGEQLAYFGEEGLVRVSGTFSYISGMAAFLQFMALLGVGLYVSGARSLKFLVGLAIVAAALPSTGSRAVIFTAAAGTLLLLAAALYARLMPAKQFASIVALISALLAFGLYFQDAAWEAMYQRYDAARDEGTPRIVTAFTNAFAQMEISGLIGFGTGATNLAAVALVPPTIQPYSWLPVLFEEESGRIVLELGVIGWILSITFRLLLLAFNLSLLRRRSPDSARIAAVLALPFNAFSVYAGNGVFAASYMAVGFWVTVGLLVLAARSKGLSNAGASGMARPNPRTQSFGRQ